VKVSLRKSVTVHYGKMHVVTRQSYAADLAPGVHNLLPLYTTIIMFFCLLANLSPTAASKTLNCRGRDEQ